MALDDKIYELRREKLKQIEALGQHSYPTHYAFTHTIPQVLDGFSSKTGEELEQTRVPVKVAGRIMAIRLMGKAGFAHLQQDGKRLQIYVKKDAVGEKGFELYRLLDLGDHIGVAGYLFRTRTGELSVHAAPFIVTLFAFSFASVAGIAITDFTSNAVTECVSSGFTVSPGFTG